MENNETSLSGARKRGSGPNERTTITLDARTNELRKKLNINFSAWACRKFLSEFGEGQDDPVLLELLAEKERLKEQMIMANSKFNAICLTVDNYLEQSKENGEDETK